ncbi:MAG TPA: AMP-binding protein, partial [Longimicrobium sp.]|nr:AMP-binding protein [Longimicrobium sp.]
MTTVLQTDAPATRTAHVDTFARDHLPPRELWPELDFTGIPELAYPARLNCAVELLDRMVETGHAERTAILWDGGRWSYCELREEANRIAHALVEDLGVVPGNRVLLRGPNSPMMAACWFGILKAGGIVVATMPLLRARELAQVAEKARIELALTDARLADDLHDARALAPVLTRCVSWGGEGDSLDAMTAGKPADFANVDTAADDVALIAFTSGTTGKPKGTMHFHRDVMAITDCFPRHVLRPEPDDVFTGSPPLAFT